MPLSPNRARPLSLLDKRRGECRGHRAAS